jgi:hypothetical protein
VPEDHEFGTAKASRREYIQVVAITPDGKTLVTAGGSTNKVKLWSIAHHELAVSCESQTVTELFRSIER